jgi:hypothetical protein
MGCPEHDKLTDYFHAREGSVRIPKKCAGTGYVELVFLYPMRSVGDIVHSGDPAL